MQKFRALLVRRGGYPPLYIGQSFVNLSLKASAVDKQTVGVLSLDSDA